jgi:hypothetical protein
VKSLLMNQMYQMYLFEGSWFIKKYFFYSPKVSSGYLVHRGSSAGCLDVFCGFSSIIARFLSLLMYQMYIDEPLGSFKRFFRFGRFRSFEAMNLRAVQIYIEVHLVH